MNIRAPLLSLIVVVTGAGCTSRPPSDAGIPGEDAGGADAGAVDAACEELFEGAFASLAASGAEFGACSDLTLGCVLTPTTLRCDGRSIEGCPIAIAAERVDDYELSLYSMAEPICDDAFDTCGSAASTCEPMIADCLALQCAVRPPYPLCAPVPGTAYPHYCASEPQDVGCLGFEPVDGAPCDVQGMNCLYCGGTRDGARSAGCWNGTWRVSDVTCHPPYYPDGGPAPVDSGTSIDAGNVNDGGDA